MKYLLALAFVAFLSPSCVNAEPTYRAVMPGVVVTLHSEDCTLTSIVSNLPKRATWQENGLTYEGCFGFVEPMRLLIFYFREDKSVAPIPAGLFVKVVSL